MDKILEYTHLLHFKEILPDFPDGDICSSEEPDFLVHYHDNINIIGIELTQFFKPDLPNETSFKAQDELGKKIAREAKCLYLKSHNLPLIITITPMPEVIINGKDISLIAEKIVNLIERTNIEAGKSISLKRSSSNFDSFPEEVGRLDIRSILNQKKDLWAWSGSGWYSELDPEHIQKRIDDKEPKLKKYKSKCENVWLLFVADDSRNPSFVDFADLALKHKYKTEFNRVFFFWNEARYFIELQLIPINE